MTSNTSIGKALLSQSVSLEIESSQAISQTDFDFIIVGGGMVGASLAAGLAQTKQANNKPSSVLVLEHSEPKPSWLQQAPLRVSAVNRFSEQWLRNIGCWDAINDAHACQFKRLATWEKGTARLEFNAEEVNETHLGYLVRNEALQLACYDKIQNDLSSQVQFLFGAKIHSISSSTETLSNKNNLIKLTAGLVIGADGANSVVRQCAQIGISGWEYQQNCFSITVKTDFENQDITWQEFQPSGPKAFLPLNDGYASLIWYDSKQKVSQLKAMSPAELKQAILTEFPDLPGDFEIVQTAAFPLARRQANRYFNNRVVLVGDAAHTINPLAGQGVNLGYKDNATLIDVLTGIDIYDFAQLESALKQYERTRKADSLLMSGVMDSLYHLFSNEKPPLKLFRKGILGVAHALPMAKKLVMKKALGL